MADLRLSKNQREELEALAEFGGKSFLVKSWWRDRTIRSLIRRGFMTWRVPPDRCSLIRLTAITAKGRLAIENGGGRGV